LPGRSDFAKGYDGTSLPGQNTHAFQAKKHIASRFSGIAGFASAGLPGRSLARSLVAEAKVCVRLRLSSERSKRAVNLKTLNFMRAVFSSFHQLIRRSAYNKYKKGV
jgi:hypothetical protein